jgi:hypothetical protein
MNDFDIIEYLSGLTTYVFDKSVLVGVARDRGVLGVQLYEELEQEQKDLLLADLLYKVYVGANSSASISQSNGKTKVAVGSQTINDKTGIYNVMYSLYKKWGDDKLELVTSLQSTFTNEIIDATMSSW